MTVADVRKLHAPQGYVNAKTRFCYECSTPAPCRTILALGEDPLATPLVLPRNPNGTQPGDPRFAIRVRNVYGECVEQIVEASSLVDALEKAMAIPFAEWVGSE